MRGARALALVGTHRLDVLDPERDVAVLAREFRGLVHGNIVIRDVGQPNQGIGVDVVRHAILGRNAAWGKKGTPGSVAELRRISSSPSARARVRATARDAFEDA